MDARGDSSMANIVTLVDGLEAPDPSGLVDWFVYKTFVARVTSDPVLVVNLSHVEGLVLTTNVSPGEVPPVDVRVTPDPISVAEMFQWESVPVLGV